MPRFPLLLLVVLPALPADPDFSGTWVLGDGQGAPRVLKLKHQGAAVECEAEAAKCSFTIDRKESRHESPEATRSTVAKWEGDTIVLNTIVMKKNGGQYTEMDRWTLSRDGNSLRIRRQIVSLSDQREQVLTYAREGAAPAAALASRPALHTAPAPSYTVQSGTKIPLALINSVNTKSSAPGDRIYLQTVFPVLVDGRVVIPPGSFVNGTVTQVKRPGRVKGRGELYIRFDSLILPNGTARDFRARIGAGDARAGEQVDRDEGRIKSEGNKGGDTERVADTTIYGASAGALGGAIAGAAGKGAAIGAGAGAAVGLAAVLLTRGPEAQLATGSVVEMVLDRELLFTPEELDRPALSQNQLMVPAGGPPPPVREQRRRLPGRGLPF